MLIKPDIPNNLGRFAIAFSGGGDSTALVHILKDHDPKPLILIVDHGLRDGSRDEAEHAKTFSESLALETLILTWAHNNPKAGLQEKARKARYGLMGGVCRERGIAYLLTGHTQDDQAETLLMRYDRGTDWRGAAGMAQNIYAPIWPELAEVTLVRPLLGCSRRRLRDYNRHHNLKWSEDPSNQNRGFTRIRARDYLSNRPHIKADLLNTAQDLQVGLAQETKHFREFLDKHTDIDDVGIISLNKLPPARLMTLFLRAASGTGGPIHKNSIAEIMKALKETDFPGGTLAGAYVMKRRGKIIIGRDPVAAKGRGNQPAIPIRKLSPQETIIWDGRFKVQNAHEATKIGTSHTMYDMDKALGTTLGGFKMSHPVSISQHTEITSIVASRLHKMMYVT